MQKIKFEPDPNPAAHAQPCLAVCHSQHRHQRDNIVLCSNKIALPAAAPELLAQSRIMARILVQAENHQNEAKVLGEHP